MASRMLRRSGVAVGLVAELLEWQPKTIYQVGVGIHHEEVVVLHETWPDALWFGCEPHPGCFLAAKANYPGLLIETAIGSEPGRARLFNRQRHQDGASLHLLEAGEDTLSMHDVAVNTLDGLFVCNEPPALLWLDCEGSELAALQGGARLLELVEVVNVELTSLPAAAAAGWPTPAEVHCWLKAAGFRRQWVHTQRCSAGQVDAIYVRPRLFRPEFCCCPCEFEGACGAK